MRTTGTRTHHSWPALYTALLLTAGIAAGYRCDLPFLSAGIAAPVLILAAFAVLAIIPCSGVHPGLLSVAGLAVVMFTGAVLGFALQPSSDSHRNAESREPVTVIGTVLDPPSRAGNALRFRCALHAILTDSLVSDIDAAAMVAVRDQHTHQGAALPEYGMTVALHGTLESPRGVRNPGEFDAEEFYRAQGIPLLLTVRGFSRVHVLEREGGWWVMRRVVVPARNALLAHIDTHIGGEAGELLKGLMIGERSGLSPELRNAFLISGVAHILAVSGSNVAVVAAAVLGSLLLMRIPRRAHAVIVASALLFYMVLTGSQPSVVRATIMGLVALAVSGRGIRGNPLNAVGIAALIMYGIDARQLFDPGFQLSFAAVLSILILYPQADALIGAWKGKRLIHRFAKSGLRLGAVSLAASVGTFPLTAVSFGQVSLIGLLANIVVVPVSGWAVVLGLCSAAMDLISTAGAESLCALNALALSATLQVVRVSASVPCASIPTHWFAPVHTLPFLCLLGMACHVRDGPLCRRWFLAALCAANAAAYAPRRTAVPEGTLTVTVLDVGQGDAILIEHPDGAKALIDTGPPSPNSRSGLLPYLSRRGIRALDLVLITHAHSDHAGGLTSLRTAVAVGRLLTHTTARPGTLIPWKDDCRLQVLFADPDNAARTTDEENANRFSVVVRLVYGNTAFLFAADAEQQEEERMIAAYADGLRSAVLKVGHHGSPSATSCAWLDAVRPRHAVISVGRGNRFGHPSALVLRRLSERGIAIARTDEDGAVMVASDGNSVRRIEWR